jgi:DNA-directed RNA polymerase subunit alpha
LRQWISNRVVFGDPPAAGGSPQTETVPDEVLNRSVYDLDWSVRTYNCLYNARIQTVGELVQKTEAEVIRIKHLGRKSLNEIKAILANMGLSLGMRIGGRARVTDRGL